MSARGTKWVGGVEFVLEDCCSCGMLFAMTADFQRRRLKDRASFYCPAGHQQHYIGKSEEQKLREQLERERLAREAESGRATLLEHQRDAIARNYGRMRERIKNGVCPCCNRTFQNLLQHMQTKHPDFGRHQMLKALRDTFGLTQCAIAEEIGIPAAYVSNYERERPVPAHAVEKIMSWVERCSA